jgi:hypothetical protein
MGLPPKLDIPVVAAFSYEEAISVVEEKLTLEISSEERASLEELVASYREAIEQNKKQPIELSEELARGLQ